MVSIFAPSHRAKFVANGTIGDIKIWLESIKATIKLILFLSLASNVKLLLLTWMVELIVGNLDDGISSMLAHVEKNSILSFPLKFYWQSVLALCAWN